MTILVPSEPSTMRPAADQRRDPRHAFRLPVTLVRGREEIPLATEDVSFHGLFLETDEPPPLRHLLRLRLLIPPFHRELRAFGMAVHAPRAGRRARGVGVQLYALDRAARTIWGNFVMRVRLGDFAGEPVGWAPFGEGEIRFLEPEIVAAAPVDPGEIVWLDGGRPL